MKYNSIILFVIIISALACNVQPNTELDQKKQVSYSFQKFSKEELKEDLAYLINKLDSTHYNLYHEHTKTEFQTMFKQIQSGIKDSMNLFEFYYHVLPLYDLLKDAHSSVIFPFEYTNEYEKQGGQFIPLEVEIENGHLYISKNYSQQEIASYSEIVTINRIPSEAIIQKLELLINNERNTSEEKYMARFFDRVLYPFYEFDENYSVEILSPNGNLTLLELKGVSADVFQTKREPFYQYYSIGDSIGVIDLNLCEGRDQFASFCDSVFTVLQTKNISNLIIDIRDNGGGSTFHGDTLLTYITKVPFTQYAPVNMKISPMVNSETKSIYFENYDAQVENSYSNQKRFKGDVYMIANENSFSSATMLAATFKCYNMGALIGQETGGVEIFFDEPIMMTMPNTGLRFLASYQYRWCACGKSTDQGIIPDYETIWDLQDKINGVDTEMELIKELIKNKQATTKPKLH